MMKEINCNIIRDILPLYVDEVVSEDTKELVSEHLETCQSCRQELEQLRKTVAIPVEREAGPLKRFKKKWKQARFRTSLISILCTAVVLAALTAGALWYTRPMTLEELYPQVSDWSSCDLIQVTASYYATAHASGEERYSFDLSPEDPEFGLILDQLLSQTYRRSIPRSLFGLLSNGGQRHMIQAGDFQWNLVLRFSDPIYLPDGSSHSGAILHFNNFYGALDIWYPIADQTWYGSTTNFDQWLSDVMDIIRTRQD